MSLTGTWNQHCYGEIDYNPGPFDEVADFVFYEIWMRRKIKQHTAHIRSGATSVVLDGIPIGWVHENEEAERTPRDVYGDYNGYVSVTAVIPYIIYAPGQLYKMRGSSGEPNAGVQSEAASPVSNIADSSVLRCLIKETGLMSSSKRTMTVVEMGTFARGRMNR